MSEIIHAQGSGVVLNTVGSATTKEPVPVVADLQLDGRKITGAIFKAYGETINAIGSTGGGTQDIDLSLGNVVTATVDTSANTFTFSNPLANGVASSFTLFLANGGSQTVNWPGTASWSGGTEPTLTVSGTDIITFTTVDGGDNWWGFPKLNMVTPTVIPSDPIESTFAVTDYTGTGAGATITTGIDLDVNEGMVLISCRSDTMDHQMFDTLREAGNSYVTNYTSQESILDTTTLASFTSTGFTLGTNAKTNTVDRTYTAHTFRKSPKFFDVQMFRWQNAALSHALQVAPGMIIIRPRFGTGHWSVAHRSANGFLLLDDYVAPYGGETGTTGLGTSPTSSWIQCDSATFNPKNFCQYNEYYTALLFAHDITSTGLIRCGTFTASAGATATVTGLPFRPQFVMFKCVEDDASLNLYGGWFMLDTTRGWAAGADKYLLANTAGAEVTNVDCGAPTADGFTAANLIANKKYIYVAIKEVT